MKTCPNCGFKQNPFWRNSRYDYNAEYMAREDFKREYPLTFDKLKDFPNGKPLAMANLIYYNRGKKERQVYRVESHDFKVPRK